MRTRTSPRFGPVVLGLLISGAGSLGCEIRQNGVEAKPPVVPQPQMAAVVVTEEAFASAVHRLLREREQTPARSALLAGTVKRQLAHAASYFDRGDAIRGTHAVIGALYLLRIGEARPDMFDRTSIKALSGAIKRFSARGDEGRALALMLMLRKLVPPTDPLAKQLDQHLAALKRWMKDTRTGGDMQILTDNQDAAVGQSVLEPTADSLAAAARAVSAWIERAVEYNLVFQETRQLPPREEALEAFRALQSGAHVMAAIFLRHGRARDALKALEKSEAGRITRPAFFARVRAAALDDTAEDWRKLAREFARARFNPRGDEPQINKNLLDAALWGISVEAYRRDPTSHAIAHLLASHLVVHGMPEAAPLVLRDALRKQSKPIYLAGALRTVIEALSNEAEVGSVETARRIVHASKGILEIADQRAYRAMRPSSAQLRQVMASIELQSGHVDKARPLFRAALEAEPTVWGYNMLALIERQTGHLDVALSYLVRASELPEARIAHLDAATAKLLKFEILRDKGQDDKAKVALEEALSIVVDNRSKSDTSQHQVRSERLLARILDSYGARARASGAIDRAIQVAHSHRAILGSTVLAAIGRALTYGDIVAARSALQTGIKAKLDRADLVYGALWLMLLEKQLKETPDGKVNRVLLEAVNDSGWTSQLARWARGMTSDAELRKKSSSYSERIEAEFYIAMRARVRGDANAKEQLTRVANNPLIDLMEVRIARELLARKMQLPVPAKYTVVP